MKQEERRLRVIELVRQNKTQQEMADILGVHRNTIYKDMKWLKENIVYDFRLLTNEILNELHTRIDDMKDRDLISFFGKLTPQKIEADVKETIKIVTWDPDAEKNAD